MTLGNDHNGTDGQTDGQTDRVRRNMRPPPREEGRIITFLLYNGSQMSIKFGSICNSAKRRIRVKTIHFTWRVYTHTTYLVTKYSNFA